MPFADSIGMALDLVVGESSVIVIQGRFAAGLQRSSEERRAVDDNGR